MCFLSHAYSLQEAHRSHILRIYRTEDSVRVVLAEEEVEKPCQSFGCNASTLKPWGYRKTHLDLPTIVNPWMKSAVADQLACFPQDDAKLEPDIRDKRVANAESLDKRLHFSTIAGRPSLKSRNLGIASVAEDHLGIGNLKPPEQES